MRALLVTIFLSSPAIAQDVVFSPARVEACLAEAGYLEAARICIGASAQACMEATVGGETTVGMGGCLDREWEYWDGRLNAAYQRAMAQAKAIDAEIAGLGATGPNQAEALRAMQRAWLPFRDAKCEHAYSQWGGGTGGGPASISCLMVETGEQALYLENIGLGK